MILLSLDAALTKTGYAVTTGLPPGNVLDAGILRPKHADADAHIRGREMAADAIELADEHAVTHVLIERPAPQAPLFRDRAGNPIQQRAQAHYGEAVGSLIENIILRRPELIVATTQADEWTRRVKKKHRATCMRADYPGDFWRRDPGMDMADALCMAQWWWRRQGGGAGGCGGVNGGRAAHGRRIEAED